MYWHFETGLLSIAVLAILLIDSGRKAERARERVHAFRCCVLCGIAAAAAGIADALAADLGARGDVLLLVKTLYCLCAVLPQMSWLNYALVVAYESICERPRVALSAIYAAYALIVAANRFTGALFTVAPGGGLLSGPLQLLPILVDGLCFFSIAAIVCLRRRSLNARRLTLYLLLFPAIMWLGAAMQLNSRAWLTQGPSCMIALLAAYIFIRDLENRKIFEALAFAADTDPLTGLMNRAAAGRRIAEAMANHPDALCAGLLIDLDDFKSINDNYGHPVGDAALLGVAELLRESFRSTDVLARLGGDEFFIFLCGLPDEGALSKILEKVLDGLRCRAVVAPGEARVTLRCSIGAALERARDADWETIYRRADAAAYSVKRRGGANYAVYSPQMALHADARRAGSAAPTASPPA